MNKSTEGLMCQSTTRIESVINCAMIGDVLGKAAVGYSPEQIKRRYGGVLTSIRTHIPAAPSRSQWRRFEVTDDTILLFTTLQCLVENRGFDGNAMLRKLMSVPARYAKGRIEKLKNGINDMFPPALGNGASIRAIGLGLCIPSRKSDVLLRAVVESSKITHTSKSAIQCATALAVAVSARIDGATPGQSVAQALLYADMAWHHGVDDDEPDVRSEFLRVEKEGVLAFLAHAENRRDYAFKAIECVPLALSISLKFSSPKEAIIFAANQGGDADTLSYFVGCLVGAGGVCDLPKKWLHNVERENFLCVKKLASSAAKLRILSDLSAGESVQL